MPFDLLLRRVPDPDLGPLLTRLADAGYPNPEITPSQPSAVVTEITPTSESPRAPKDFDEIPSEWRALEERKGDTFRWPEYTESYDPYVVYEATTQEGTVRIALGHAERKNMWGRDRPYVVGFLTGGKPVRPLVEFLASDDYESDGTLVAVIRGVEGSRRVFGPSDPLPEVYGSNFRVENYGQMVRQKGVWNKYVVVAQKDDPDTMLNHALLQARRRKDI